MASLAEAFLAILPDLSGFGPRLRRDTEDEAGDAGERAGDSFGKRMGAAVAVAGAAAAAALVAGLASAIENDKATDRLAAQLGATPAVAEKYGKIAGELYSNAYGESFGDVTGAIGVVVSSFKGMNDASSESLKAITANALDFADAFEIDIARAAAVAGTAVNDGLAVDAKGALDLFTVALQKTPAALRENILDAVEEYGAYFKSFGFSGDEAMGILVAAAEKGQFGIDKIGDAIKESQLLMTDIGNKGVQDAYKAIGLDAEKMSASILKGGDTSKVAFQKIVTGLQSIKDPNAQAAAALALFGTPLEDMNKEKIPEFLDAISKGAVGLGEVSGAADKLGATLADNASASLETFKRKAQLAFVEQLAKALPYIEATLGWLSRNSAWVGPLAAGLAVFATVIATVAAAMKVWAVIQTVLNLALWTSPITWIVVGVLLLVAAIVLIATKTTWFQTAWSVVWEIVLNNVRPIAAFFSGPFADFFVAAYNKILSGGEAVWRFFTVSLPNGFRSAYGWIRDTMASIRDAIIGRFLDSVNYVANIPGRILGFFAGLGARFRDVGRSIVEGVVDGIENAMGWLVSKAKEIGTKALDTAKKAIGFGSPAEKFIPLGESIPQGMGVGVDLAAPDLSAKLSGLFDVKPPPASGATGGTGGLSVGSITVNGADMDERKLVAELDWFARAGG